MILLKPDKCLNFLSMVLNFPVQYSLKGPFLLLSFPHEKRYIRPSFATTFLYHCIFGIPILSHYCCRGLVSTKSIRILLRALSFFHSFIIPYRGFSASNVVLSFFTNLHNSLTNKNIYLCV